MAWIRGKNPIHKFLAWVFQVTGQSIDKDHPLLRSVEKFFNQSGFDIDRHTIKYPYSEVLVIIAKKREKA
jgi:hypothetical protein